MEPTLLPEQALAFYRCPTDYPELRNPRRALRGDAMPILQLALGAEPGSVGAAPGVAEQDEWQEAARFFIEQVLLAPGADYYRVNGLPRGAGENDIRDNHRLLMRLLHPDRSNLDADWQAAAAARANQAYATLRDPLTRAAYDQEIALERLARSREPEPGAEPAVPPQRPDRVRAPKSASYGWPDAEPLPTRRWRFVPQLLLGAVLGVAVSWVGWLWLEQKEREATLAGFDATTLFVPPSGDAAPKADPQEVAPVAKALDAVAPVAPVAPVVQEAPQAALQMAPALVAPPKQEPAPTPTPTPVTKVPEPPPPEPKAAPAPPPAPVAKAPEPPPAPKAAPVPPPAPVAKAPEPAPAPKAAPVPPPPKPAPVPPPPAPVAKAPEPPPVPKVVPTPPPAPAIVTRTEPLPVQRPIPPAVPAPPPAVVRTPPPEPPRPPQPVAPTPAPAPALVLRPPEPPPPPPPLPPPVALTTPSVTPVIVTAPTPAPTPAPVAAAAPAPAPAPRPPDPGTVLPQLTQRYAGGDLDGFMALFDAAARNETGGRAKIRSDYADLFSSTARRNLSVSGVNWVERNGVWNGDGRFQVTVQRRDENVVRRYTGTIRLEVVTDGNRPVIRGIFHNVTGQSVDAQ